MPFSRATSALRAARSSAGAFAESCAAAGAFSPRAAIPIPKASRPAAPSLNPKVMARSLNRTPSIVFEQFAEQFADLDLGVPQGPAPQGRRPGDAAEAGADPPPDRPQQALPFEAVEDGVERARAQAVAVAAPLLDDPQSEDLLPGRVAEEMQADEPRNPVPAVHSVIDPRYRKPIPAGRSGSSVSGPAALGGGGGGLRGLGGEAPPQPQGRPQGEQERADEAHPDHEKHEGPGARLEADRQAALQAGQRPRIAAHQDVVRHLQLQPREGQVVVRNARVLRRDVFQDRPQV